MLLHPTSLPGPYGIGDLGYDARRFIDLLVDAGQSVWQILPLGPPGLGDSPYAARSSFAGDPRLISFDLLVEDGLLDRAVLERTPPVAATARIDFVGLAAYREPILRRAYERSRADGRWNGGIGESSGDWLEDFVLFETVRGHYASSWPDWPADLRAHDPVALAAFAEEWAEEVSYHGFLQWCFDSQWSRLKKYANDRGVAIFGDIPIFPAFDSADVWAHRDVFKLDEDGNRIVVAGVPPDAFSATGQRWGNPLYRWDVLESRHYDWWVERMRHTLARVDIVRIDHFRGFASAWEIPAAALTAIEGEWIAGPGPGLFEGLRRELGDLRVVVEDLGVITPEVEALRDGLGLPGMKVLQFAFSGDPNSPYLPHNYSSPKCVVYTGTHDNDTTAGWFASLTNNERARVLRYLDHDGSDPVNALIAAAYASIAQLAVIPMQDVLKLGSEARMNLPGSAEGHWGWRFDWEQVDPLQIQWLREKVATTNRLPPPVAAPGG